MAGDIDAMTNPIPLPPARLRAAGRKLWCDAVRDFDFTFAERVRLASAAHLEDEIHRMETALAKTKTLVPGSMGQERPNPLFAELRAHRAAQSKLLGELVIDDAIGSTDAGLARSSAGRKMAGIRWHGRGA